MGSKGLNLAARTRSSEFDFQRLPVFTCLSCIYLQLGHDVPWYLRYSQRTVDQHVQMFDVTLVHTESGFLSSNLLFLRLEARERKLKDKNGGGLGTRLERYSDDEVIS